MKPDMIETPVAVDRIATPAEILAAVLPFPDPIEESALLKQCAVEILDEISTDAGGFVRMPAQEVEISFQAERLIAEQHTWIN